MLNLEVVLGCPNFISPAFLGATLRKLGQTSPRLRKASPEMNRKGSPTFSMTRLSPALTCPVYNPDLCKQMATRQQISAQIDTKNAT